MKKSTLGILIVLASAIVLAGQPEGAIATTQVAPSVSTDFLRVRVENCDWALIVGDPQWPADEGAVRRIIIGSSMIGNQKLVQSAVDGVVEWELDPGDYRIIAYSIPEDRTDPQRTRHEFDVTIEPDRLELIRQAVNDLTLARVRVEALDITIEELERAFPAE